MISLRIRNTAPFLRIREKNIGDFSNGDYFELALTNASWLKDKITEEQQEGQLL
jgi:hypothetical protein